MTQRTTLLILPIWVWILLAPFYLAYYTVYYFFVGLWKLLETIIALIERYNTSHPSKRAQKGSPGSEYTGWQILNDATTQQQPKAGPGPRDWTPKKH